MTTNYQSEGIDVDDYLIRRDMDMLLRSGRYYTGVTFNGWAGDNGVGPYASSPRIVDYSGPGEWKSISCRLYHTYGLKTDGTIWGWGNGGEGRLGAAVATYASPITPAGGGTNWRQVRAGAVSSYGLKTDGTLWCWGRNTVGQLGDGTTTSRLSPVTTAGGGTNWKFVNFIDDGGCGIKTDGTLWTWGSNFTYQLGDGSATNRSSPVTTSGGGTNWKFAGGGNYFGFGIKTDGTLWVWGSNGTGELGDGSTIARASPVTTAGGGTNWAYAAGGFGFMAATKTDGTLWTWGLGSLGRLGSGSTTDRSSPATVAGGGTTWRSVNCGIDICVAVKTDGTAWAWGQNEWGEVGDGTSGTANNRSSPVSMVGGITTWKEFYAGEYGTAGIATYDMGF